MIYMPVSGTEMLRIFIKNGWVVLRQKGSHVMVEKGRRVNVIPMHRELKKGLEHHLLKILHESKVSP